MIQTAITIWTWALILGVGLALFVGPLAAIGLWLDARDFAPDKAERFSPTRETRENQK